MSDSNWLTPSNEIAAAAIFIAIGLAVWQVRKSSQLKRLEYEISSSGELFTLDHRIANRVEVLFDGSPVHDIRVHTIRFIHTGNKAISRQDWDKTMLIEYPKATKVITAKVISTPQNLDVGIQYDNHCVIIDSILINPQESIKISVVVSGLDRPEISCRIIDGSPLKKYDPYQAINQLASTIGYILLPIIFAILIGMIYMMYKISSLSFWLLAASIIIGSIAAVIGDRRIKQNIQREIKKEKEEFPD